MIGQQKTSEESSMPKDQKILEAIAKTGFVLEHDVVNSLQNEGWKTMSGSYYIDDVSNQKKYMPPTASPALLATS